MKTKRRRRIAFLLLLAPLYLATVGAFLVMWGSRDRAQNADAILIFGARVAPSGQASPILRARTRHAFELWQRGLAPKIVCTGGRGTYPPAEAEVQKQLLRGWGVPEEAILVDDESTSTRENARNAASLLPPDSRVIAVSEPFHLWRCRRDCQKVGLVAFPSPEIEGWKALRGVSRAYYALREAILVTRDLFL
ncbi:MAG TPA: YdcF family protein [Abditibacterium sp.]